jgi:hypothetical protein
MSEHNDFESRLRDALRTEGDSARVSPDALRKIRGRIEQPSRRRTPKRVIAFGVMAAAAACTAAVIVVPQLTGGPELQSASAPESASKDSAATDDRDTQAAKPGAQELQTHADRAPILGELIVGKDVNVLLMASITGDTATARLSASKWEGGKWSVQQGNVTVGAPGALAFDGSLSGHVCEFRVVQTTGKPATVRVRLAQQRDGVCSDPYVYELDGTTLTPK